MLYRQYEQSGMMYNVREFEKMKKLQKQQVGNGCYIIT